MKSFFNIFRQKPVAEGAVLIMIMAVLMAFAANVSHETEAVSSDAAAVSTLVIDAGHGGIDGGAIGVDGSKESDLNLAIALKLEALCAFYGCDYIMTRVDDSRAADALKYSEQEELKYRTELVNSIKTPVLISIHQNCYPTAQPSGAQVIYSSNGYSESFGKLMHSNIVSTLDPQNRRVVTPDKNKIYILNNVNCPAILLECGFVSNHSDITKLNDPEYQRALSAVMLGSYIQYYASDNRVPAAVI